MNITEKIQLPDIKHIIAVASGKGGVGKSTVSANLAIALARNGFKTALVDTDIYGPSIPRMFGIEDQRPEVTEFSGVQLMIPIEKCGVKIMSMGFFAGRNQGLIWRGPMVANATQQLFQNTLWEDIDYLIIDLPPGTGDVQLTVIQKLNLSGAIMVTTPQEIALNDTRKAASMFVNPDLNVPILGVVENMSWFTPAPHPDEKYFIFGQGGGEQLAQELNVPLLSQIPLVAELGEAAEKGLSVFAQSNKTLVKAFESIAEIICNKEFVIK
jgi:ATP-binding protein involved in chromosome partitioning